MKIHFIFVMSLLILVQPGVFAAPEGIAPGIMVSHDLFNNSMCEGVGCYRIPSLVTTPDGVLIAVMDERMGKCADLHDSKDTNLVMRRSEDNGLTWSALERIVDFEYGKSASDTAMIVDWQSNEVFLLYNVMDFNTEPGIYRIHVIRSKDNGLSWGEAEDITAQITKASWHKDFKFVTSGRGIQTRSGDLLHCLVNMDKGVHLFGSRTHGKDWFFIDTPLEGVDESKVVELADGSWMVNSRITKKGGRYVFRSDDQGAHWQGKPEPALIDPSCNASLIRYTSVSEGYDKNRLLFANAKSKKKRENLTVRISYDEAQSWSEGKTIYSGSSEYSSLTILNNGHIALLFEKDIHKENVFVVFSLEWLTDGQDSYTPPQQP